MTQQIEDLLYFGWLRVRAVLTKDPSDDLHEGVRYVGVLLQYFEVDFDGRVAELLAVLCSLIFAGAPNELVGQLRCDLISANLEELVHISDVPVLIRSEVLAER